MKLIFSHIIEHKILQDISIPFSSEFNCSYDGQTLSIEENPDYLPNYYEGLKISAIIGTNGSGKTSILEFIENSTLYNESRGIIVWFREKDRCFAIQTVNHDKEIEVKLDKSIGKFDFLTSTRTGKLGITPNAQSVPVQLSILKVSNVNGFQLVVNHKHNKQFIIDKTIQTISRSPKKKISFMKELFHYLNSDEWTRKRSTRVSYKFTFKGLSPTVKTQIFNVFKDEGIIKYLHGYYSDQHDKPIDQLDIADLIKKDIDYLKRVFSRLTEFDFNNTRMSEDLHSNLVFNNIFTLINKACFYNGSPKQINKILIVETCLFILGNYRFGPENLLSHLKGVTQSNNERYIEIESNEYPISKQSASDTLEYNVQKISGSIEKGLRAYRELAYTLSDNQEYFDSASLNSFTLTNVEAIFRLEKSLEIYSEDLNGSVVYGWDGFSSGELARIGLFSLIFNHLKKTQNDVQQHTLIAIDEADIYLHPEWQRTFVSDLIEMIRELDVQDRVQVILSTHSPLIICDFLTEDIISIKAKDGHTEIGESLGFGTKLSDSYLQGMHLKSTFGEHSREKLQDLIDKKMSGNKLTGNDLKLARKISNTNVRGSLLDD